MHINSKVHYDYSKSFQTSPRMNFVFSYISFLVQINLQNQIGFLKTPIAFLQTIINLENPYKTKRLFDNPIVFLFFFLRNHHKTFFCMYIKNLGVVMWVLWSHVKTAHAELWLSLKRPKCSLNVSLSLTNWLKDV